MMMFIPTFPGWPPFLGSTMLFGASFVNQKEGLALHDVRKAMLWPCRVPFASKTARNEGRRGSNGDSRERRAGCVPELSLENGVLPYARGDEFRERVGTTGRDALGPPPTRGRRHVFFHLLRPPHGAAGYDSAASTYLPSVSSTPPVTASRIRVSATSSRSCRPASASAIAALVRGVPSASSPRMSGVTRSIMAFSSVV